MEIFDINGLKLRVSEEHRFGTDAVRLAEFAAPVKSGLVICDLCTGCGIVPFLLLSGENKRVPKRIYALDINAEAIGLLNESVKINSLEEIIFPLLGDLRHITGRAPSGVSAGSADMVTVNPPYYKTGGGLIRERGGAARHELLCELDDVAAAAAKLLKFGGRLKMCHVPERLADVVSALRKYGLEPKAVEFLTGGKSKPWLMLVDAKKGGKPGMKIRIEN